MSALATSNLFYTLDGSSQSPPKPASPVTPTSQFTGPQLVTARSFINLNPEVRGQHAPFPITPTTASSPNSTLEPPPGMSFAEYLKTWSDSQTIRWLAESKCTHLAETFKANDIRGDILLELDQATLKEMGITSIGDRLRILNAVKNLRIRAANRSPIPFSTSTRHNEPDTRSQSKSDGPPAPRPHNKRPAPLRLNATHSQNDLPAIIREQPDSARSTTSGIRPLPQPNLSQSNQLLGSSLNAQNSAYPGTPGYPRSQPPFPPPRGQPPLPPPPPPAATAAAPSGRSNIRPGLGNSQPSWANTPTGETSSYSSGSLSLPLQQQTQLLTPSPSSSNWNGSHHSSADSRPSNPSGKNPPRSNSPLSRGQRVNTNSPAHGRNGSGSLTSPSTVSSPLNKLPQRPSTTGTTGHPYANAQAQASTLSPPTGYSLHTLSPIDEQFNNQHATASLIAPSPISQHPGGHRPLPFYNNIGSNNQTQPTLDEIRRKLVKFVLPDEGLTYTIDVAICSDGIEVLEKVLKKFGKGGSKTLDGDTPLEYALTPQGGLTVNGWGVYLDFGQQDGPGRVFFLLQKVATIYSK